LELSNVLFTCKRTVYSFREPAGKTLGAWGSRWCFQAIKGPCGS
jgi:hypothetical protein